MRGPHSSGEAGRPLRANDIGSRPWRVRGGVFQVEGRASARIQNRIKRGVLMSRPKATMATAESVGEMVVREDVWPIWKGSNLVLKVSWKTFLRRQHLESKDEQKLA